ncbi:MAG: DedA family protein [Candidatus Nanopelagicales bacterium]
MLSVLALLPTWLSGDGLIKAFGDYALYGVIAVIFAECGILLGFVFPGDSLIFALGMLTATGVITQPIWLSMVLLIIAAIAGNMTGYWIGSAAGHKLFTKQSRFFKPEYVDRTSAFFERYGNRAIIFARFVPIVRTVITALAGVGQMNRARFFKYSAIGGVIWVLLAGLLGFWLGNIEFIRKNFEISLVLIVAISFVPIVIEGLRMRRDQRES